MKQSQSIKILVGLITTLSILSGTINKIFPTLFSAPNLTALLSISPTSLSIEKGYQFLTHLFFYPAPQGIHIFYLIHLFFGILILQRMGSVIVAQKGEKGFLSFFLTCGIVSGIAAYTTLHYCGYYGFYAGPTSALYSLFVATLFLFPKMDMVMFFSSPMKGRLLFPIIIGIILLMNLSVGDYVHFFATLASCITAYLYILFFWKIKSPFISMAPFDNFIVHLSSGKFRSIFKPTKLDPYISSSRIFDIRTGKAILSEENFINAVLEKISKEGKSSLTLYERFRLYRHSKKGKNLSLKK
jgi:hypothetical protein